MPEKEPTLQEVQDAAAEVHRLYALLITHRKLKVRGQQWRRTSRNIWPVIRKPSRDWGGCWISESNPPAKGSTRHEPRAWLCGVDRTRSARLLWHRGNRRGDG